MHKAKKDPLDEGEAIRLINKALSLAADKNLPIEKQMKLFLTWGVIYRENGQVEQAQ